MRVLLAEDNAKNVELFVAALAIDGHDVTVERDGLGARERALREAFDLIVLDIQMPLLDGYALCAELRASGIRGPIIALSAAAMPSDIERGKEMGFDAYLTKPIRPGELRAAVRSFQRPRR
ncbi:MAG TPA: response regulator [Candidatus Limnocylindria bacterium]|jgi:two-component system response regulator TctD|nr:response regulator [Candidatus Limnocylindria bacterium]